MSVILLCFVLTLNVTTTLLVDAFWWPIGDTGICKGRALLFNNALDLTVFAKCIKLSERFYTVIWSLVAHVNCCCHVVRLFVIFKSCLINRWTVYCNGVRWPPYH